MPKRDFCFFDLWVGGIFTIWDSGFLLVRVCLTEMLALVRVDFFDGMDFVM